MGKLFEFMEEQGLMDNTLIVFTSDHGDYFGDHHLGEKDFFHDCSARVPLIICDPSMEADATRGTVESRPVELIDLIPTFIDVAAGEFVDRDANIRLDGKSLLPLIHNQDVTWKDYAVCEIDFGDRRGPREMGLSSQECWSVMLVDEQYKYIAFHNMRPMLFDLVNDPKELVDLGEHPDYAEVRNDYKDKLLSWFISGRWRTTMDDTDLERVGLGVNREKKG